MQTLDYTLLLKDVIRSAKEAGEMLVAEYQRPDGLRGYGDKADVDLEVETLLKPQLLALLDCDFWGEETGSSLTGHQHCWVVDPNDGTADFLKGRKGSAISIGLLSNKQPVLGVVYTPVLNDRPADCIAWAEGLESVQRNGQAVNANFSSRTWGSANKASEGMCRIQKA